MIIYICILYIFIGDILKKQGFLYNVMFMITSGVIIKALGLLNKVMLVRILGIDGIYLYTLCSPTIGLLLTLAQFGLPLAISKLVSQNVAKKPYSNRSIIIKSVYLSILVSLLLIILLLCFSKVLCNSWLKNPNLYYPILTAIPLIPLTSFTGILKGYLNGLKIMDITSKSNIYEQIARIIFSLGLAHYFMRFNVILAVCVSLLALSIGELVSLIYLLYKIKKITPLSIKTSSEKEMNKVYQICVPITLSRMIAAISNFLEPIIFTICLSRIGLNETTITYLYGSILGFSIPLLTFLSFVVSSFSTAILPVISEAYEKKDYKTIRYHISKSLKYVLYPCGILTILLTFYSNSYMNLIYGINNGANYVSFMAPFFILFYFEGIFIGVIQGINKMKEALIINSISQIIKLLLIFILSSIPQFHSYGLAISIIISLGFNTLLYYLLIVKYAKYSFSVEKVIFISLIFISSFALAFYIRNINYIMGSFIIALFFTALYLFNYNKDFTFVVSKKNIT